jgi:hypothetical protein
MRNVFFFVIRILRAVCPSVATGFALLCWLFSPSAQGAQTTVVPLSSSWKFYIGTNEASSPTTAWREIGFDDSSWGNGAAPIGYSEPGSTMTGFETSIATTFPQSDASPNWLTAYFRKAFTISSVSNLRSLTLTLYVDDGAVAWINGVEVGRTNVPAGDIAFNCCSPPITTGEQRTMTITITNLGHLVAGENILAIHALNETTASTDFLLEASLVAEEDTEPPTVSEVFPPTGATVSELTEIQVRFSEAVTGINASDLRVNGVPVSILTSEPGNLYRFQFPQPPTGVVQVAWSATHGIQDFANPPHNFAGGSWTYNLNTNALPAILIISEFLASNSGDGTNALRDEEGDAVDWIEIRNIGSGLGNLNGWFLTDNAALLTKWRFPDVNIPPNGYLVVFASEKHPTTLNQGLHTNFRLNDGGEYLALVGPRTNIVSVFSPTYPPQTNDISYGRDQVDPSISGYFQVPTPGGPNTTVGAGIAPPVEFSRSGSVFISPFSLTLSTAPGATIRYTIGGAVVTNGSPLYTGPLNIATSSVVRARTFQTGLLPGPSRTEGFLQLTNTAANWSSDLPVVILHTFGNTTISGGAGAPDTPANVTIIEPDLITGRTRLTDPPVISTRAGINLRGSSTQGIAKRNLAVEYWDEANADREIETLEMPAESDWVLYPPNGFDHPLIHNSFIYEASRQVGRYAPRTRFVELFYKAEGQANGPIETNTSYFGVYILTEKIKRDNNRVNIPNLDAADTNSPAVTGGYLFLINTGRIDANERAAYVSPGFIASALGPNPPSPGIQQEIIYQDPEGPEIRTAPRRPQESYITNYLRQFAMALTNVSFTNLQTGYNAYIDVDSWIDHHILNVLARNVDAIRLSGYFFKDRDKKIEFGPIWDFDRAMGTGKPSEADIGYRSYNPREWLNQAAGDRGTDFFRYQTHQWWGRLFEDVDFWQKYIDRWVKLRRTHFTTNSLFDIIDRQVAEILEAQTRENRRWAGGGSGGTSPRSGTVTANGYTFTFDGTYLDEIRFLKTWLTERMDFIDTNFLAAPRFSIPEGRVVSGTNLLVAGPTTPAGSIIFYTVDGTDPRRPGGGLSPTALIYSGPITITTNMRVFARSYNMNHRNLTNGGPGCNIAGGCPPLSTPWSGKTEATYYLTTPPLRITEIMYHPQDPPTGNTNEDGNFEYVELRNTGATPLNLNRFRIRGGIEFDFPNMILAAGSNIVVVADQAAFQSRYGTAIPIAGLFSNRLDNAGERLILEGPVREPILDFVYEDDWYPATDGFGFSLVIVNDQADPATWGLKSSWRPSGEIDGSPGAPGIERTIPLVVINEVLTHSDPPPPTDTIELLNLSGTPADIGGWFLTDDFREPKKYRILNGTMVSANGFITFNEGHFNAGPNSFSLSSLGEEVWLFSGDANTNLTGYAHGFDFGAAENGRTFGRYVISTGTAQYPPLRSPTLGAANSGPLVGPIVITEINYHPPDFQPALRVIDNDLDEYIELHNMGDESVPLYDPVRPANTWRLRDAVDFDFPTGVSIPGGGFILVVGFNPADTQMLANFRSRNLIPMSTPVYGPFQGKLDNSGEAIELERPDVPEPDGPPNFGLVPYLLVERIRYSDEAPWPAAADGLGPTLQRLHVSAYGNDPTNWVAAGRTGGAPLGGGAPPTITQQPADQTVVAGTPATLSVLATGADLTYQWRFNGQTVQGATNASLVFPSVKLNNQGTYDVTVMTRSGWVQSSNAVLTVLIPVAITLQPTNNPNVGAYRGSTNLATWGQTTNDAIFALFASSARPISYQWRSNGVPVQNVAGLIHGATSNILIISNVNLTHNGTYQCFVQDSVSSAQSDPVTLTVAVAPFVLHPEFYGRHVQPVTALAGEDAVFSVVHGGTPPFAYRWQSNSVGVVTNYISTVFTTLGGVPTYFASFTVPNVRTSVVLRTYRVIITNAANPSPGILSPTGAGIPNAILTVLTDTDGDGAPDVWETQNGFDPNNNMDGRLDTDGDGMSNAAEFRADTDPNNATSYLKVDQFSVAGAASLSFLAVSNKNYTVEYHDALDGGPWLWLTDVTAVTTNRIVTVLDTNRVENRYYRLLTPIQP